MNAHAEVPKSTRYVPEPGAGVIPVPSKWDGNTTVIGGCGEFAYVKLDHGPVALYYTPDNARALAAELLAGADRADRKALEQRGAA